MRLSNKLTFFLVFSVLLVAVFAFVVTPAMAQVTVTMQLTEDVTADSTVGAIVQGKEVVTIKFSVNAYPAPVIGDFSVDGTTPFTDEATLAGSDAKTFTLTFLGAADGSSDPSLTNLTLRGYTAVDRSALEASSLTNDPPGTPVTLAAAADTLVGKTYSVYGRSPGSTVTDTQMPTGLVPTAFLTEWPADLEEFFNVGGGTIDLNLTDTKKNSRHIVINEIMWAVDNRLVGLAGHENQQWIEIFNNTTYPIPTANISFNFINNLEGLNPPPDIADGTADRLSNIPNYVSVWNVKGQNGMTMLDDDASSVIGANPMFVSMYRNNVGKNGWDASAWSVSNRPYLAGFYGTPNSANTRASLPGTRPAPSAATPAMAHVLINEVYDAEGDDMNDWLEIRALQDTNLKNWSLGYVNNSMTETSIFTISTGDRTIKAGEIWLIVNTDPTTMGMNLAAGNDVTEGAAANQTPGRGDAKYLVVPEFKIPEEMYDINGDTLLTLRSSNDAKFLTSRSHLQDLVGTGVYNRRTLNEPTPATEPEIKVNDVVQIWQTKIFPLNGQEPGDYHKDHADRLLNPDNRIVPGNAWARNGNNKGWLRDAGGPAGYKGGIGYDRDFNMNANGTPGYDNGAYQSAGASATDNVYISEIMYAHTGTAQSPPQWIELHNPSRSVAVDLNNFRVVIKNHDQTMDADGMMSDWMGKGEGSFLLNGISIPPGQTVLIASANPRRSMIHIPNHRIFTVFNNAGAKGELGMSIRGDAIFNTYGFSVALYANGHEGDMNKWQMADEFSNLADPVDDRRGSRERFDDVRWMIPNAFTDDDERVSIARMRNAGQGVFDGRMMSSWVFSNMDSRTAEIDVVYFGSQFDISTPGQTKGSPLPVQLSFFRPTLQDGQVTIRWTTESELDNAGFNIYRSETRNGEFKQVNSELIAGAGTTGERTTYNWVDATAKPGVVYYYQIEDVSFAGEHQVLATTKLKGLISAAGKATTTWGEIKNITR